MNRLARHCGSFLILLSMAWTSRTHAQPDDRRAAAQLLFEQAKTLIEAARFADACPKLAESLRLDAGIGTSLWLADCYENEGRTASAWAQFKEAAASAALQRDERANIARERAASLEKRLSRLQIALATRIGAPGLELRRDGVVIGTPEVGLAVPVDPGVHTIAASAPGRKSWTSKVTVSARPDTVFVTIPILDAEPKANVHADDVAARDPTRPNGRIQRIVGIAIASVGLVSVGMGTYFSLHAKSTYDHSNEDGHCVDNRCDDIGKQFRGDARTDATLATLTIGVGAAAIAGGAIVFLTAPNERSVAIVPTFQPQAASVVLRTSW